MCVCVCVCVLQLPLQHILHNLLKFKTLESLELTPIIERGPQMAESLIIVDLSWGPSPATYFSHP
jgi:hypothetical protein